MTASTGLVAPTPGNINGGAMFATDILYEASTPDEGARAAIRQVLTRNPDFVKLWVDDRNGTKAKLGRDAMAASDGVGDVACRLDDRLADASPDLLRAMVKQFAEALMGAETDAVCGAGYRERSERRTNSRNRTSTEVDALVVGAGFAGCCGPAPARPSPGPARDPARSNASTGCSSADRHR